MSLMLGLYTAPPTSGGTLVLDASPFAHDCAISTNKHGAERLSATIDRSLIEAIRVYSQEATLYVGLFWGGTIVWEGRLEDPALWTDDSGSGLKLVALGYWRALYDDRYTALWSRTSVAGFRPIRDTEVTGATPDRYEFDTNNRIYIAPKKNATLGNTGTSKFGMQCYLTPDQGTRDIIGVSFDFVFVAPAANWRVAFQTRNADFSGIANPWLITSAGAGTVTGSINVTFAAAKIVNFFMDFNAADVAYGGETGANYLRVTNLRLVTSTTNRVSTTLGTAIAAGTRTVTPGSMLRIFVGQRLHIAQGSATVAESVIVTAITATTFTAVFAFAHVAADTVTAHVVYADEIAKDIVAQISTLNTGQLSSSTALIESPALDLTDEVYEDAVPADILTYLAGLGDNQSPPGLWEVGVGDGQILFFRPQGSAGRTWYVDATALEAARSLDEVANSIYATYRDASNRTLRTANATDSDSISRAGLTRRTDVHADTTSSTQAGVQRGAALEDRKDPKPHADIHFDAVYDANGARWPLWAVRASDTTTARNLSPAVSASVDRIRTFLLSHTEYHDDDTLAVEPEEPLPRLEVLLARRNAGIR